ncbi:hypothetical protein ESCO_005332 [Escovopsis weberi]|uniref:Uncharacterized protein n=1 Tax=Escovopsis weberi TaxID=150374 RepID=A0A0M9VUV9_ESCWE|nr:hypothetical protein ESCO_005332 [Escovopsis weberi]
MERELRQKSRESQGEQQKAIQRIHSLEKMKKELHQRIEVLEASRNEEALKVKELEGQLQQLRAEHQAKMEAARDDHSRLMQRCDGLESAFLDFKQSVSRWEKAAGMQLSQMRSNWEMRRKLEDDFHQAMGRFETNDGERMRRPSQAAPKHDQDRENSARGGGVDVDVDAIAIADLDEANTAAARHDEPGDADSLADTITVGAPSEQENPV